MLDFVYAGGQTRVHTIPRLVSLASRGRINEQNGGIWSERPSRKSVGPCPAAGKRANGSSRNAKAHKILVQSVLRRDKSLR